MCLRAAPQGLQLREPLKSEQGRVVLGTFMELVATRQSEISLLAKQSLLPSRKRGTEKRSYSTKSTSSHPRCAPGSCRAALLSYRAEERGCLSPPKGRLGEGAGEWPRTCGKPCLRLQWPTLAHRHARSPPRHPTAPASHRPHLKKKKIPI